MWLRQITTDAWYGCQYTVKDAGDATVACCTSACHTAFLPLAIGQVVTTISPPLFVSDISQGVGASWPPPTMVDITAAGIVPMAALFEQA